MVSVVAELMTHAVAESIARAGNVTVATPNADVVTARFESLVYRRPGDGPALSAPRYDRYGPATGGDVPDMEVLQYLPSGMAAPVLDDGDDETPSPLSGDEPIDPDLSGPTEGEDP